MAVKEKKVRSVAVYLQYLEMAGRSEKTLYTYKYALEFFCKFLGIPVTDLHAHKVDPDGNKHFQYLTMDNLMELMNSEKVRAMKSNSRRSIINNITRYMKINGVEFDELELGVIKVRRVDTREDKPASLELLQKMMDLADPRMKAYITFLTSTGCRSGEASKLLVSDVNGTVVTIPDKIAKGHRGGKVYLTSEAREYLDLWIRVRDQWIRDADTRVKNMGVRSRPTNDQRLFASSSASLRQDFAELYHIVDGESIQTLRGVRGKVTAHTCRAYFRTNAAVTMGIDLAEGIVRHTGYMNAAYVRMPEEDRERKFREGEDALYITRRDRRLSENALEIERMKTKRLEEDMLLVKTALAKLQPSEK
nr:site-specific integrase [uncultured Methanoregula sp.]